MVAAMERTFLVLAGINGFLAVALGAFGAHGLQKKLEGLDDAAKRLGWWETAAHYHLTHALALGLAAYVASRAGGGSGAGTAAGWLFLVGIALFSGSLYTMTLTGVRWLGAVTPVGGLCLLAGWAAVVLAALRLPR